MRKTTLLLVACFWAHTAMAQGHECPGGVVFTDNCATACVVCGIPVPIYINNGNFTNDPVANDCLVMHNNMWFAFMAAEPQVTFTGVPSNCNLPGAIQMALYESCDGQCIGSDYGCTGGPVTITMFDLVVGNIYLLVIDGCSGAICDIVFSVDPPSAIEIPPINNVEPIVGPDVVCTNGTFTYCIPALNGANEYVWTVPSGVLVNGLPGPNVRLPSSSNGCAEITFGNTTGPVQICVRPSNTCHPGNQKCKIVNVQRIPTTILPPEIVCPSAISTYELPWGEYLNQSFGTSTYQHTYLNNYGCDSLVKLTVTVPPLLITFQPPIGMCPGECITFANEPYCTPGEYSVTLVSTLGCDSVVQLNFLPANISADILPADSFTCQASSVTLHSSQQSNAMQTWSNASGTILGTSNSVVVAQPGMYFLSVSRTQFNKTCTLTDSVVVSIDTLAPFVSISADSLGCGFQSAAIHAASNAVSAAYQWTGPGGFSAAVADTAVLLAGAYQVMVTNLATGCSNTATVTVHSNFTAPDLIVDVPAQIDCNATSVSLNFHSASAVSQEWLGPNGFVSTLPQPQVSVGGVYTITVRDSLNCVNNTSVTVIENTAPPVVSAVGDTISCTMQTGILQADVAAGTSTYSWSGPGGFSSSLQNPVVDTSGEYSVVATGANGCTAVVTTTVAADLAQPDLTLSSGMLSCATLKTWINSQSNTPNTQINWSGPGGFQSNLAADSVSVPGTYVATVSGLNGCATSDTLQVTTDETPPIVTVVGEAISCTTVTAFIDANASSPGLTYAWSGPQNFSATVEDVSVSTPGIYILTATNPANGCKAVASFEVEEDITEPSITATGGVITCAETTVQLEGSAASSSYTWLWTGPNGFNASSQMAATTEPGSYELVATNPANGCTSGMAVTVQIDTIPLSVNISGMDTLTCAQPNLFLNGAANGQAQWLWTLPDGSNLTTNPLEIQNPGLYSIAVTGPNGCTRSASVVIAQDIAIPVLNASGDTLDCFSGQATLNAQSQTAISFWNWIGPAGFTSPLQNPVISVAGVYTLTAQGPNGCDGTAMATISENNALPQVLISGAQTLTCTTTTVNLEATISPGATGQWNTGATNTQLTVLSPGTFTYTATGANGCQHSASINITQDIALPQDVGATSGNLNCNMPSTTLHGSSTSSNVSWSWTGPGMFGSSEQHPGNITTPGTYTLTVSNIANGCSATSSATVTADFAVPQVAATADTLSCTAQQVQIQTSTGASGLSYLWTGPGSFTDTAEDPLVAIPGQYNLVATAANGCTGTLTLVLAQNIMSPGATAAGATLDCNVSTGYLTGISSTPGATYLWSGPNGFQSTIPNPAIAQAGAYNLVVTGTNGCSSTAQALVATDLAVPALTAQGGVISCATAEINLTATSSPGVQLNWSGPGNFQSNLASPLVNLPGQYSVTATGPNGCVAEAMVSVPADTLSPAFSIAAPAQLDCNTLEVSLMATVTNPAIFSAAWSTADGHLTSGINSVSASVDSPGIYSLLVTNLLNACALVRSVHVLLGNNIPSALVLSSKNISCYGFNDGVITVDSVKGGTEPILFALDNGSFSANKKFRNLTPGNHTIRLQDASGCALEAGSTLTEPNLLQVSLGSDTLITLGSPIKLLVLGAVSEPQRVTAYATSPILILSDSILYPLRSFTYKIRVRDNNNCSASDEQIILVNRHRNVYIPNIFKPDLGGQNDLLAVYGGPDVRQVKSFQVFDRWGDQVHEALGFVPDGMAGAWDGRVKGQFAAPGVFVYVAEIEFVDGEVEVFKGDVTVVR